MNASQHEKEEKGGFWRRYKFLIIGLVGALLLASSLSTQNVIISYQTADETQYAVKLDYSAFGMCLRCYPGTKNANDVVEKAFFFGSGRKVTVERAAAALIEIAGESGGRFWLQASNMTGANTRLTDELVACLNELGYSCSPVQEKN